MATTPEEPDLPPGGDSWEDLLLDLDLDDGQEPDALDVLDYIASNAIEPCIAQMASRAYFTELRR